MVESIAESIESMAAMTWAEANQAYLRTELRRLRLLFRRKVRWLRHTWQQDPLTNHRSVVISDAHADRLLSGMDDEESRFHQEDAESCAITRALEAVEADLDDPPPASYGSRRDTLPGSAGAVVRAQSIRARCGFALFRG